MRNQRQVNGARSDYWLWLVFSLLLYILSIGPVAGVYNRTEPHGRVADRTMELIYSPLIFLVQEKTPLQGPLTWWVDVWVSAFRPRF